MAPPSDVNAKEPGHFRHGWTWQYCPTGIHEISLRTGGAGNGGAMISRKGAAEGGWIPEAYLRCYCSRFQKRKAKDHEAGSVPTSCSTRSRPVGPAHLSVGRSASRSLSPLPSKWPSPLGTSSCDRHFAGNLVRLHAERPLHVAEAERCRPLKFCRRWIVAVRVGNPSPANPDHGINPQNS